MLEVSRLREENAQLREAVGDMLSVLEQAVESLGLQSS